MLALISPAKTLDFKHCEYGGYSQPKLLHKATELIEVLEKKTTTEIKDLMKLSDKLAELNVDRFANFNPDFKLNLNAKQAVFAFKGDVYNGIDIDSFTADEVEFLNQHLLILSGLYGVLRPLDLIMPYRLEMGTKLKINNYNNLYQFWGSLLSKHINSFEQQEIVNLSSNEYFKAVDKKILKAKLIQVDFKENKDGNYKIIGVLAKRARGRMVNFIAKNKIKQAEKLKEFNFDNYVFNPELSNENNWIFSR